MSGGLGEAPQQKADVNEKAQVQACYLYDLGGAYYFGELMQPIAYTFARDVM